MTRVTGGISVESYLREPRFLQSVTRPIRSNGGKQYMPQVMISSQPSPR